MRKNIKKGFSVGELIITTVILAVVMIIAPMGIISKRTPVSPDAKVNNFISCKTTCLYSAKESELISVDVDNSNITTKDVYDIKRKKHEMYTIIVKGGGGGGTENDKGLDGTERKIYLPSIQANYKSLMAEVKEEKIKGILTGYYLLEAGKGGKSGESGEPSVICAISYANAQEIQNGNLELKNQTCKDIGEAEILKANGGITSNETPPEDEDEEDMEEITEDTSDGSGGEKGEPGKDGIIKIQ